MLFQDLCHLSLTDLATALPKGFPKILRRYIVRVVRVKVLKECQKLLLGENLSNLNSSCQKLSIIDHAVPSMIDVLHDGLDPVFRHLASLVLLERLLQLYEAYHAGPISVDLLESLAQMRHLSLVEHLYQYIHSFSLELGAALVLS